MLGASTAACSSDEDQEMIITSFLTSVRNTAAVASALLVLVVERNYGGSVLASRIGNIAAQFEPMVIMTQEHHGATKFQRAGVITTKQVKERMRVDMSRLLRTDKFKISKVFFGNQPDTLEELQKQILNYKMEYKAATSSAPAKIVYSGKGFNKNDDLAIVTQLLCFWPACYAADPENSIIKANQVPGSKRVK